MDFRNSLHTHIAFPHSVMIFGLHSRITRVKFAAASCCCCRLGRRMCSRSQTCIALRENVELLQHCSATRFLSVLTPEYKSSGFLRIKPPKIWVKIRYYAWPDKSCKYFTELYISMSSSLHSHYEGVAGKRLFRRSSLRVMLLYAQYLSTHFKTGSNSVLTSVNFLFIVATLPRAARFPFTSNVFLDALDED